jgi:hypothetical protein
MSMITKDIAWFKKEVEPNLSSYEVNYRYFEKGDFGSLSQVSFEREDIGGQIDYWGLGWLGIYLYDGNNDVVLINILLAPEETGKSDEWINKLVLQLTKSMH